MFQRKGEQESDQRSQKKLHVRVISFQTQRDTNYEGLNVRSKVKFMHKEIFSFNCVHEGAHAVGTPEWVCRRFW